MAQLDRTDLAIAETVELLFIGGSVLSVRTELNADGVAITFQHDGPLPRPGLGTRQLLDAACASTQYDEHALRLDIEVPP